ncbi:rod shape-determining protein MreC [Patescibacteria group bacterium]
MRIFITAILILILGLLDILNPLRSVFQNFTTPVQYGLRRGAINLKETYKLFGNLNDIRIENLNLLKEKQELEGIIVNLKTAEEENKLLRNQLELKNQDFFDKDLLLALVMGNPNDVTGTSMVLDKGKRQGVQVGDNVVVGNFLVGIITKASEERSIMNLVISPDVSMTVINVEPISKAEGIARGNLGTSIEVTRLLPGEIVEKGDVFVTSGKDGKFLPELVVGQVSDVVFESAEPLKSANLMPMVDFSRLDKVFIILNL